MFELAREPEFATLPIILEDFIKDHGARYNSKLDVRYNTKMDVRCRPTI